MFGGFIITIHSKERNNVSIKWASFRLQYWFCLPLFFLGIIWNKEGNIHVILGRGPIFSSDVYASTRYCVRSLRGPAYCMDAIGLYSNKQLGYVGHKAHAEADSTVSVQRIKSFQDTSCSLCMCCTADKWIGRKLGTSGKPLDLQHLCTQSCSVCVLKIGSFKAHLYCAAFIKLIRVPTVMFWPALQVPNSLFQTIILSDKVFIFSLFVCLLVCFFSPPWKYIWEIQSNGSPTSGESGTKG